MEIIEIKTLIDITDTDVRRPNQGTQQQIDQCRNWTTLKQCVELRSVVAYDVKPTVETIDITGLGFGKKYRGKHQVWTWRFRPDREQVYTDHTGALGALEQDIDQVPIIQNLTESINIEKPVFDLSDLNVKNTLVKMITGN